MHQPKGTRNEVIASSLLRCGYKERPQGRRRNCGRKTYSEDVKRALKKIWAILDFPSGKRLVPFIPEVVPVLESFGELTLKEETRAKIFGISSATVDRLLRPERTRLELRGRTGTKPGSLLKNDIPAKTFADWNDTEPGFLEIDLVAHDGGS
ncbi:MAG: integrase, partial [Bacillota bacterium]